MSATPEKEFETSNQVFERNKVIKIIDSVLGKVQASQDASTQMIYSELAMLAQIIHDARAEISSHRPEEISDKHIASATDELDAIVESTAEATGTIMDCCEVIEEKVAEFGDKSQPVVDEIVKIYEACSFQDITGQRITKIVKTLKVIEEKVEALVKIIGDKAPGFPEANQSGDGEEGADSLLNGPQLPNQGVSQDDIDRLLDELDDL